MKWRSGLVAAMLVALVSLATFQGCLVQTRRTLIVPQMQSPFKGTYEVSPYMEKHRPVSVAILPFVDRSRSKKGVDVVRKGFYNHFSSMPFRDMELYRVDELLEKAALRDAEAVNVSSPQDLGKILGVDAVIYGTVSNFDKLFAVMYSHVSVGAEIKMYDTKTGNFLWSGQHVVRIHEEGIAVSPVGIVATIVATAMNIRDIQLLRACDDLFREMVKTIPAPHPADVKRPPTITLLTQDTKNLPRKAGDEIKVVIQGTPKMQACFDIGQYRQRIDMQEVDTGWYLGVYKVVPGDNISGAVITGYLKDDDGNEAQWVDALGTVTMDTEPPAPVAKVTTLGRDGVVMLTWEKSTAPDLAEYRVYRSETPLSGFQLVAKTEFNELRDHGLVNGRKYYYRVSAADQAGNESAVMPAVIGLPITPGPTPVAGPIETDSIWYAGASPYVISETITVKDGATLVIEAGTEVRAKGGGGLIVEGVLSAQGEEDHLIVFDAAAEANASWGGITFSNVHENGNVLKFCRVRGAATAISCRSCSPSIEALELVENSVGLRIAGAFAKPRVLGSTIRNNRGTAVLIEDGAQPLIAENRIQDNAGEGILVRRAGSVIQHNNIARNGAMGIHVQGSQASIRENNIVDNKPLAMKADMTGEPVDALANWWGKNPPDMDMIWGDMEKNININPYREKAEEKAFFPAAQ